MNKFKNITYTFIGNIVAALIKWLILILIVRITNPEMVGYYTFAIALTSPIMLFANMRLRLRYVVEDDLYFKDLKKIRHILDLICTIMILLITYLFLQEYLYIIFLITLTKVLDLSSELYYAILQKKEDFKTISLMMIGKNIGIIITFTIIIIITKNIYLSLIGQNLIQLLWLIIIERKSRKSIIKENRNIKSKSILLSIFIAGLPLGFVQLLNSYNILIPRYIIEDFLSLKAVGIFASVSYLLTIMDLFMNAISQNFISSIKKLAQNNEIKQLKKFLNSYVFLGSLILGLATIFFTYTFGEKIITLVYGNEYAKESVILVIISISITFNFQSWMFDSTLMALKVYNFQLIVSIITFIVSIVVSLSLIEKYDLVGAAISVVVITMVQAFIKYMIVITKINKLEA